MNINGKDYRANDVVKSYKPFAEDTDSKMLLVVVGRKLVLYDHVTHIDIIGDRVAFEDSVIKPPNPSRRRTEME